MNETAFFLKKNCSDFFNSSFVDIEILKYNESAFINYLKKTIGEFSDVIYS